MPSWLGGPSIEFTIEQLSEAPTATLLALLSGNTNPITNAYEGHVGLIQTPDGLASPMVAHVSSEPIHAALSLHDQSLAQQPISLDDDDAWSVTSSSQASSPASSVQGSVSSLVPPSCALSI